MFLSISRFAVANTLDDAVRDAFLARPHLVDVAPGFIRMEVANPCTDAKEFWLLTWWQDEAVSTPGTAAMPTVHPTPAFPRGSSSLPAVPR